MPKKPVHKKHTHKAKRRSSRPHRANPSTPDGMVLVPASMVGTVANPAKKKHHRKHRPHHHHHPRKHNPAPEGSPHSHVKDAATAVGFGALAAIAGLAGGFALAKAGLKSKGANVAANVAAGAAIGGALGMIDRIAGTVVAHNYMVAAGQWLTSEPPGGANSPQRRVTAAASNTVTPRLLQSARAVRAMNGPVEVGDYEKLQGVVADNMAGPDELGGYERLEGVVADNMAGPEELSGYERLEGVMADNLGGPEDMTGAEDVGDTDRLDALDPDVGDELGEEDIHGIDDMGDADLFA